ncbi:hypothetical protein GCM10027073_01000 [Streptomyces chlorus]
MDADWGSGSNPLPTGSRGTAPGPPDGGAGGVNGAPGVGAGGAKGAPGAGAGAGGVKGAPGAGVGAGRDEGPEAPTACGGGVNPGNGGTRPGETGGEGEASALDPDLDSELPEAFCVYQAGGA